MLRDEWWRMFCLLVDSHIPGRDDPLNVRLDCKFSNGPTADATYRIRVTSEFGPLHGDELARIIGIVEAEDAPWAATCVLEIVNNGVEITDP